MSNDISILDLISNDRATTTENTSLWVVSDESMMNTMIHIAQMSPQKAFSIPPNLMSDPDLTMEQRFIALFFFLSKNSPTTPNLFSMTLQVDSEYLRGVMNEMVDKKVLSTITGPENLLLYGISREYFEKLSK